MTRLVVDASARIETLGRPALAAHLFGAFDACAPALLRWEVGNVVHGRHAKEFGDLAKRKAIVAALLGPVRLVDQAGREGAIADLVAQTGLTFYDAAYLQLALDEGAIVVTQDRRLHAEATKLLGPGRAWTLDEAASARSNELEQRGG